MPCSVKLPHSWCIIVGTLRPNTDSLPDSCHIIFVVVISVPCLLLLFSVFSSLLTRGDFFLLSSGLTLHFQYFVVVASYPAFFRVHTGRNFMSSLPSGNPREDEFNILSIKWQSLKECFPPVPCWASSTAMGMLCYTSKWPEQRPDKSY